MAGSRVIKAGFICALALLSAPGCSDETVPPDAPDGHTVMKDGAAHAPGLHDPTNNCVSCHGADLKGGGDGEPSCYSCHGREW